MTNSPFMFRRLAAPLLLGAVFLLSSASSASAVCCKCQKSGDAKNICLTDAAIGCADLISSTDNPALKGAVACDPTPLSDEACKALNSGSASAVCQSGPYAAKSYASPASSATAEANTLKPLIPALNTPIPGLQFATILPVRDNVVSVPYLAQYVNAFYKYLLGVTVVAAAIMVTYGGFLYLVGSSAPQIANGRQTIESALVGLALVFGSYTILQFVNPRTVSNIGSLDIRIVKKEQAKLETLTRDAFWQLIMEGKKQPGGAGSTTSDGGGSNGGNGSGGSSGSGGGSEGGTGSSGGTSAAPAGVPGSTYTSGDCAFTINSRGFPTKLSVYECAIKVAKANGVPPCYLMVGLNHESWDGLPNSLGFDENASPLGNYEEPSSVIPGARVAFLRGRKYSKARNGSTDFSSTVPQMPNECSLGALLSSGMTPDVANETRRACFTIAGRQSDEFLNNDILNLDPSKPDLGLSWQYSRGIGLGQTTIFGRNSWCKGGIPSAKFGDGCFTAQQLFDPYQNISATTALLKKLISGGKTSPDAVWAAYGGSSNPESQRRASETATCLAKYKEKDPIGMMKPSTICRGDVSTSRKACQDANAQIQAENKNLPPDEQKPGYQCGIGCFDLRYPVRNKEITP